MHDLLHSIRSGPCSRTSYDMKWNESGFRPPLCTYRLNWARRTSWGWWDDEMTLSSRHRIRNSSPGGLRPSTLPLGHGGSPQYWLSHVDGEETFLFLQTAESGNCLLSIAESGNRTPNSGVKGSGANHYPRAPAHKLRYIVGFGLVEMAISTNPKPTIYCNLYENTGWTTSSHGRYVPDVT